MTLQSLLNTLETIAPLGQAEAWDNVGLLVGDPAQDISAGLLCIDYTPAVADETRDTNCDFVLAYHPPIFKPLKHVLEGSVVYDAIRRGVAIYSPHTALDVADGGTNDVLADVLNLQDRRPLRQSTPIARDYKFVTFAPADAIEKISQALFNAGAGRIGKYSQCSFRSAGTGTFFGEEGTNPAVGQAGQLEQSDEIRIETIVAIHRVDHVIAALRKAHPYEEPAFDLNALAAPPTGLGLGRVGRLPTPLDRPEVFEKIKQALGINELLIAGPTEGPVTLAAVGAGAGGDLLDAALIAKADLYLTGELRHHDALKAAGAGMTVVCTLHSRSERLTLKRLRERLSAAHPNFPWRLSEQDQEPFQIR